MPYVLSSSRTGGCTCTYPGVDEEGPRDGDAMLLPSALALPIGEGLDEPVCRRWR